MRKLVLCLAILGLASGAIGLGIVLWPSAPLQAGVTAGRVVVVKSARRLLLMNGPLVLKSYRVSLGAAPVGHKQREGDARTPEGAYVIDYRNANSAFHLSLHVSYPDARDRARAHAAGVSPGGAIMIHGLPNAMPWIGTLHRLWNWTDGCIALTNGEMDEVWRAVPDGTPIEIRP